MKIWDVSIKNPVFITMIMLALAVVGIIAYNNMPLDFFPDVSFPTLAVITVYPGAGPEEVQNQVTRPIEEALVTAPGAEEVQSQSGEGFSMVLVSFNLDKDVDQAIQDIREKIANVRSELPEDILEPSLQAFDPSSFPIMNVSVSAQAGTAAAENVRLTVSDEVLPRLQRIEGVADASVSGGQEREIQVLLDASALKARNVAPQQVIGTIMAESWSIPGGSVQQEGKNLLIRTPGNFDTVDDIANLQIASPLGAVRVGDVATVQDGWKELDTYSRLDGQDSVTIAINRQSGTNTVQVAGRVHKELDLLGEARPDLHLIVVQDQSEFVEESFDDAMRELLIGALMASLVVFIFFRNIRNTLVTVAGLPFILLGTFAVMAALDMTLNIVSLLALSLSVGLIIDDAIVVRENIFRHMEMGKTPEQASSDGTAQVATPVVAMTLTIVAVFLPIAFVGGLVGKFLNSFGVVVSVAVLISLFEALTFAPMLSAKFFKQEEAKFTEEEAESLEHAHASLGWLDRAYQTVLGWTLRHRWITLLAGVALLVGALYGTTFLNKAFMTTIDQGTVNMALSLTPGTALAETDQASRELETRLLAREDVDSVLTSVGGLGTPENATFFVALAEGKPLEDFIASARTEFAEVPGLSISGGDFMSMMGGGTSVLGKPVQIILQTIGDPDELNQFSVGLAEQLKQVPGLVDVDVSYRPGKPEVLLVVDRRRAADLGLNIATIGSTVRTLVEGSEVATFRGEGPEAEIRVQLQEKDRDELDQILDLQVPTERGFVPLRQIAHLQAASGPTQFNRLDRQNAVIIGANTFDRVVEDVVEDVTYSLENTQFPPDVSWKFSGEQEMQDEAFTAMGTAMLLAMVFVYMVLASLFGSFVQPLVIMLALPLAAIGGLLALLIFNFPLDMTAMIGLILLMGLVTKNSILLVDLTNKLRRDKGVPRDDALMIAGPIRLRPILMTTLALILGMLPVAIGLGSGSGFRQPMAITVIGGLITSTLLTILLVPTAYSLVEGATGRYHRWRLDRAARREQKRDAKEQQEAASQA
ncbi:MAG: efflux RND transporter permease subunit [Chloroflexota bacterium]|nr:efflux RND transporter permease subunit [Chloroflexota bacterium]